MKRFICRFPKTFIFVSIFVGYVYVLPPLLTMASLLYFKDWQVNAQKSATLLAGDKPYCIAVPLASVGLYVPKNFSAMDI
jgi:hypothetical protein